MRFPTMSQWSICARSSRLREGDAGAAELKQSQTCVNMRIEHEAKSRECRGGLHCEERVRVCWPAMVAPKPGWNRTSKRAT